MKLPLQLVIVEDNKEMRESLELYLSRDTEVFRSVLSFESMEEALQCEEDVSGAMFLLDVNLPGMTGIEGIFYLKQQWTNIEILVLSVLTDSNNIFEAICAGASGYLDKDTSLKKIKESILTIVEGGSAITPFIARQVFEHFKGTSIQKNEKLTDRENEVVKGIIEGLSYKLVAAKLEVSINTVRKYIRSIYRKLEINSKGELISKFHDKRFN